MTINAEKNALILAFSKPEGEGHGPQIFTFRFDLEHQAQNIRDFAVSSAKKMDMPILTKVDHGQLLIALETPKDYNRLLLEGGLQNEITEYLTRQSAYSDHLMEVWDNFNP